MKPSQTGPDVIARLRGRKLTQCRRGAKVPEMTKWRQLPLETREEYLAREAKMTAAEWRVWLQQKAGIRFSGDNAVSRARQITQRDRILVDRSDRAETFETWFRDRNPGADDSQVRMAVMTFVMMEAAATEDLKSSIAAGRVTDQMDRTRLDRQKWEDLQRQAAKADRAEEVAASKLSDAEKLAKYREIFGAS